MAVRMFAAAVLLALSIVQQAIPPGPHVPVSDGWYHVPSCPIAQGRQAPSLTLNEALRQKHGPCPICEPHRANPDIDAFVKAHGTSIADEVRLKAEAEAAEAKRKEEEAAADRKRRLAEADEARLKRESAPIVRVSEAQARQFADTAAAEAKGDAAAFQRAFRAAVRAAAPDYSGPQIVLGSAALRITLAGPLAKFEADAAAAIGRGEALSRVTWSPDATLAVLPQQSTAPDVERVVVQRSDASRPLGSEIVVAPLTTTLAPRPLQFVDGTSKTLHTGEIVFPLSAFDPGLGVIVRVIAVPVGAPPINRTFNSIQLRAIQ